MFLNMNDKCGKSPLAVIQDFTVIFDLDKIFFTTKKIL